MAKYSNLSALFKAIADAIRGKTGGTDAIVAEDFPTAIEGISSGGSASDRTYFTVEGKKYYYIPGMTWYNFADCIHADSSDFIYNFYSMIAISSSVVSTENGDGANVLTYPDTGSYVMPEELIQSVDYTNVYWDTSM